MAASKDFEKASKCYTGQFKFLECASIFFFCFFFLFFVFVCLFVVVFSEKNELFFARMIVSDCW